MKLYLTLFTLLTTSLLWGQNGAVVNGGFENWSNINLFDYPTDWGNSNQDQFLGTPTVLQSTDAQDQSFAVDILCASAGPNSDTTFGYVFQGTVGSMGPDGGITYPDTFDEVRVHYKSDLNAGDSIFLLMLRYQSGVMVEQTMLPVSTSTQSVYTEATISVPNTSQDELFIGFIMGNPFGTSAPTPGSWGRLDNVRLYNSGTQTAALPDPSFEQWSSQTTESPDSWYTMNEMLAGMGSANVIKSTDAFAGTYAAEMTTMVSPGGGTDTISAVLSNGPLNFSSANPFTPIPYTASPTTFSGAYKYAPSGMDNGMIQVMFFASGTTIGGHNEVVNSTSGTWQTFSAPLTLSSTPDSVIILAFSGDNPGSVLHIDELALSGGDVGLEDFAFMETSVYPNPANDFIFVKTEGVYDIAIFDLAGNQVYFQKSNFGPTQVDLSLMESGAYLLRLTNNTSTQTHTVIVE